MTVVPEPGISLYYIVYFRKQMDHRVKVISILCKCF